jgi:hypothetical protein
LKLHILFMQRREDYDGEFAPEPLLTWDEYTRDENPEGFANDIEEAKKTFGPDAAGFALVTVIVDGAKVRDMCLGLDHVISGLVSP